MFSLCWCGIPHNLKTCRKGQLGKLNCLLSLPEALGYAPAFPCFPWQTFWMMDEVSWPYHLLRCQSHWTWSQRSYWPLSNKIKTLYSFKSDLAKKAAKDTNSFHIKKILRKQFPTWLYLRLFTSAINSARGGSINNFHTVLVPTTPNITQCMPALNVLKCECLKITICHEEQS